YDNGTAPNDPADFIGTVFGSYTAQLVWSPDNLVSELDISNAANGWVSGGEVVLNTIVGNNTYGDFDAGVVVYQDANYDTGAISLDQGYVYSRVFGSTAPILGEYYSASPTVDATLYSADPPSNPAFVEHNQLAGGDPINGSELDRLIVPEPSVLAFLGLGGLLMAVRRRLK
ncbi:MAG: PEP-CTERM sorting domain-containing protein, partial [Kiritimatiellae bacterium]|nr:PEP-CTERM sorting domain-containing protein [Kiritimatiellia bacterium]